MRKRTEVNHEPIATYVKVCQFEVVDFYDQKNKQHVIIMYSLGEDGIIREFTGGKWQAFPIRDE